MEWILTCVLIGLLIIWILIIQEKSSTNSKRLDNFDLYMARKEEWELSKYETKKVQNFLGELGFYIKDDELRRRLEYLDRKIEKIEEKNGQAN